MGLTRRAVLAGAASGAAVAGAGWAGLGLGPPAASAELLTAQELAIVRAAAEALFPRGAFPLDGVEAGVAERVDTLIADLMDAPRRAAFRYVLRTLEVGTLASRGRPFTQLSVDARREVLQIWSDPEVLPRRLASDGLEAVLGMAYFSHPAILGTIGWAPGCGVNT